jgi:UDP-2,3-diacylglucosamine hydrolase
LKKTFFISDMHLGAGSYADPAAVERRVVAFLKSIRDEAEALYMLGDVLDYWYEYRNCVPQGFVRFFGALAELADSGVKIYWYAGNHDVWLYDYLSREIGITIVDPPAGGDIREIGGVEFFLGHGDGVGELSAFMRIARKTFRNRLCRILYGAIHPRWTIGFARGCSRRSRAHGSQPEVAETERKRSEKALADFSVAFSRSRPDVRYIVLGHHHRPAEMQVTPQCRLFVLGAWDDSNPAYGVFDGKEMRLVRFKSPLD